MFCCDCQIIHKFNISGPALGSALFIAGGFTLPYIVVSSMAFVMAVVLALVVPKVTMDDKSDKSDKQTKSVTFAAIAKVSTFSKLPWDVKLMNNVC